MSSSLGPPRPHSEYYTSAERAEDIRRVWRFLAGLETNAFKLPKSPVSGYVLTCDAYGVGSWSNMVGVPTLTDYLYLPGRLGGQTLTGTGSGTPFIIVNGTGATIQSWANASLQKLLSVDSAGHILIQERSAPSGDAIRLNRSNGSLGFRLLSDTAGVIELNTLSATNLPSYIELMTGSGAVNDAVLSSGSASFAPALYFVCQNGKIPEIWGSISPYALNRSQLRLGTNSSVPGIVYALNLGMNGVGTVTVNPGGGAGSALTTSKLLSIKGSVSHTGALLDLQDSAGVSQASFLIDPLSAGIGIPGARLNGMLVLDNAQANAISGASSILSLVDPATSPAYVWLTIVDGALNIMNCTLDGAMGPSTGPLQFPAIGGTVVTISAAQSLDLKTMSVNTILLSAGAGLGSHIRDSVIPTKRIYFGLSGAAGNNQFNVVTTAARTWSLPDYSGLLAIRTGTVDLTGQTASIGTTTFFTPPSFTIGNCGETASTTVTADAFNVASCGRTINSPTVTSAAAFGSVLVGMLVTGTGIPGSTYVQTVNSTSNLTLTKNATSTGTATLTFQHLFSDVVVGMFVSGANIPAQTYVVTKSSDTSLILNNAATATATVSLTFQATGVFLISAYLMCTTAEAGTGTVSCTIGWTDDNGAQTRVIATRVLTSVGASTDAGTTIRVASGSVTYATTYTPTAGGVTEAYALYLRATAL